MTPSCISRTNESNLIKSGQLWAIVPNVNSIWSDLQRGRFHDPGQFQVRRDACCPARLRMELRCLWTRQCVVCCISSGGWGRVLMGRLAGGTADREKEFAPVSVKLSLFPWCSLMRGGWCQALLRLIVAVQEAERLVSKLSGTRRGGVFAWFSHSPLSPLDLHGKTPRIQRVFLCHGTCELVLSRGWRCHFLLWYVRFFPQYGT